MKRSILLAATGLVATILADAAYAQAVPAPAPQSSGVSKNMLPPPSSGCSPKCLTAQDTRTKEPGIQPDTPRKSAKRHAKSAHKETIVHPVASPVKPVTPPVKPATEAPLAPVAPRQQPGQ